MDFSKGRVDITNKSKVVEKLKGGSCDKWLVEIDGEEYVFKQNICRSQSKDMDDFFEEFYEDENIKELDTDISEVFAHYFLEKVGCDWSLPYYLAKLDGKNGCLSPDFLKDGMESFAFLVFLMNQDDKLSEKEFFELTDEKYEQFLADFLEDFDGQYFLSAEQVAKISKEFCNRFGFVFAEKKTLEKIQEMAVLDYFMVNTDRSWFNIVFLAHEENGKIVMELGPLFDNEESFGMKDFQVVESRRHSDLGVLLGICEEGRIFSFEDNRFLGNQKIIATDIMALTKKNPKIKTLVKNILKIDFEKCLSDFEKEKGIKLLENQKEVMTQTFEERKFYFVQVNKDLRQRVNKSKNKKQKDKTFKKTGEIHGDFFNKH